jgi:formyltetrahydrofolate synthetase
VVPIAQIAQSAGILEDELIPFGNKKAKVSLSILRRMKRQRARKADSCVGD